MACLALFVALGGAGYAALRLPKNSLGSAQLKKGAVTPKKLSAGTRSRLQGPPGAPGPRGETGPRGAQSEPGPAVRILPSGQTEEGAWAASGAMGSFVMTAISFSPPLPGSIPEADEVYLGEGKTNARCPGQGRAQPGVLCVYTGFETAVTFGGFLTPSGNPGHAADVPGVAFFFTPTSNGANARGVWAYTAP